MFLKHKFLPNWIAKILGLNKAKCTAKTYFAVSELDPIVDFYAIDLRLFIKSTKFFYEDLYQMYTSDILMAYDIFIYIPLKKVYRIK